MTCEKNTVTRSNFASRLLSKAMSERTKTTSEMSKPIVATNSESSFAPPIDAKEAISAKQ
jgi:hypothetical protein